MASVDQPGGIAGGRRDGRPPQSDHVSDVAIPGAEGGARAARGSFDASSRRVLEILANQAAATIQLIKD